jgi:putative nucleotidyltransferase with HDIG domain
MTRDEALALVEEHTKNKNLVRHALAVEAVMRALAEHFEEDKNLWGLSGLLHDADYEELKDSPNVKKEHTKKTIEWLSDKDVPKEVIDAITSHAWKYVEGAPEPKTKMEWALYTCDELTGLIVAVALVKGAKLSNVEVNSILKKWKEKSFAAGANRDQIAMCEEKLGMKLPEFIEASLVAMQGISKELGL